MVNRKKTRRRETIKWSTEKKHEGEKPYNGQQKKNMKERNHTMGQQKKPTQIEKNHTMVNRKKHEGEKPFNGQQKKTRRRETIQWSTEKPYNGQQKKTHEGEKP